MKIAAMVGVLCLGLDVAEVRGDDLPIFNVTWDDVAQIRLEPAPESTVSVQIDMKIEKAYAFVKFTEANAGKQVSVTLNGWPMMQPVVREKLPSGNFRITAPSLDEALELIRKLSVNKKQSNKPSEATP